MSSLSVVSVLILWLTFHPIECQSYEKCDFLKPNDRYEGIGVYKEYLSKRKSTHYMTNRRGLKWKFELSEDHKGLNLLPGEYKPDESSIVKRFGLYFTYGLLGGNTYYANCLVDKKNIREVHCKDLWNRDKTVGVFPLTPDFVIFRGYARANDDAFYSVILNRMNKSRTFIEARTNPISLKHTISCSENCPKIKFIDEMEISLISRLDGVVDFNFDSINHGFLLLFNIEDRPMYCFQLEGKQLSDECKSAEKLRPAFEECFREVSTISTTAPTKGPGQKKNVSIDPLYWVLIFELFLMVILMVTILMVVNRRRQQLIEGPTNSVTSRSYDPSQDEPTPKTRLIAFMAAK